MRIERLLALAAACCALAIAVWLCGRLFLWGRVVHDALTLLSISAALGAGLYFRWRSQGHLDALRCAGHVPEAFALALKRREWEWLRKNLPWVAAQDHLQAALRGAVNPVVGVLQLAGDVRNTFLPPELRQSACDDAAATMADLVSLANRISLLNHLPVTPAVVDDDLRLISARLAELGQRATAAQEALARLTVGASADTLEAAHTALTALSWRATEQHRVENRLPEA